MRRKVHYVIEPHHLWSSIAELARTQNDELLHTLERGFKYIENQSFDSTFQGLFSEINLNSEKLGKNHTERNAKLCKIISKIAEGIAQFSTDSDILGDAYEYLIGQFAAGSGKKAGEFYTPQQISTILSEIVTLDSQESATGKKKKLDKVLDFACGSGSLLLNVRKHISPHGIPQGAWFTATALVLAGVVKLAALYDCLHLVLNHYGMLFLIDQDGVLADFEHGFHAAWQARGNAYQALPIAERRTFYVRDDHPKHLQEEVESIYTAQGFYLSHIGF